MFGNCKKSLVTLLFLFSLVSELFSLESGLSEHRDIEKVINDIPYRSGRVKEISVFDHNAPWIINIQDFHCQYQAQKNIVDIIHYLKSNINDSNAPVCVEGAVGRIDTDQLASIPSEEIRSSVSDYFLKKGKITGAESYCININPYQNLVGVDDKELYDKGYGLYSDVLTGYVGIEDYIAYVDLLLSRIKSEHFSAESAEIFSIGYVFRETLDVEDFVIGFQKYWRQMDSLSQIDFLEVYAGDIIAKNSVSAEKVALWGKQLFDELCDNIPSEDNKRVVKLYLNFQLGEISDVSFLTELTEIANKHDVSTHNSEKLENTLALFNRLSQLDQYRVNQICKQTYDAVKDKFFTETEKRYAESMERWAKIKRLLALQLTCEEFKQLSTEDFANISDLLAEFSAKDDNITSVFCSLFDLLSHRADLFYKNSVNRDRSLFFNTLSELKSNDSKTAIIIAGGFHTAGIKEFAGQNKMNYAVIRPVAGKDDDPKFYKSLMLNKQDSLDELFPVFEENRQAPRTRLANLLSDPDITRQLLKETVLISKLLHIANSSELFDQLRVLNQDKPTDFRNELRSLLKKFMRKWVDGYRDIKRVRGIEPDPKDLRDFNSLLASFVKVESAKLNDKKVALGVQISKADGSDIRIYVSFVEQMRMTDRLNDNYLFPKEKLMGFDLEEQFGSFRFYFGRKRDLPDADSAKTTVSKRFPTTVDSIAKLKEEIIKIKESSVQNPYNERLKMVLKAKLNKLAQFLEYVASKEEKAGNLLVSNQLRANGALYAGNLERAVTYFDKYLKMLPEKDKVLAETYFVRHTIVRGQKISLPVKDNKGRLFTDRFGNPIKSPLLDETLFFGSEPSLMVQSRLIEFAKLLEGKNRKYLAEVTRFAAKNLTHSSKNYHHREVDVSFLTESGKDAFPCGVVSYGAIRSGLIVSKEEVKAAIPAVTYLYDKKYTDKMIRERKLKMLWENATATSTEILVPESIKALIVNKHHMESLLEVISTYPFKDIPVLDTEGDLIWQNLALDSYIEKYGAGYIKEEKTKKTSKKQTYFKEIKNPVKLVAFGDLHSDCNALLGTLMAEKVIDKNMRFTAKHGTAVVINGDFIDRGTALEQKKMIDLVMSLQKDASKHGVDMVVIMGNHEAKFLSGNWFEGSANEWGKLLWVMGFDFDESIELREAFRRNDMSKLSDLRNKKPDAMRYIDFLRGLPIVAKVGGHVFVHGGPTKKFNKLLKEKLAADKSMSVGDAIDQIFSVAIAEDGFDSELFVSLPDSPLVAAVEFGKPEFVDNTDIVDVFLSFFEGARFLGVGHNKVLGIMPSDAKRELIYRLGPAKNIIKTDVGTNANVNRIRTSVQGQAYVVDPSKSNFVYTVSQTGQTKSLVNKGEKRFPFMQTDSALLYDMILTGVEPSDEKKDVIVDKENDRLTADFMGTMFMIYAVDPEISARMFQFYTKKFLENVSYNLDTRILNVAHKEKLYQMCSRFLDYLEDIKAGKISESEISLNNFKEFAKQGREKPLIPTKVVAQDIDTVVDYETDVTRFYSVMSRATIKNIPDEIFSALSVRIDEKIVELKDIDIYHSAIEKLRKVKKYIEGRDKFISFKTLRLHDGNPGIFCDKNGTAIMGFILEDTIYLSDVLVNLLWRSYSPAKNNLYLDALLGLFGHEVYEDVKQEGLTKDKRIALHVAAEVFEKSVCGTGEHGSKLDDYIHSMVKNWIGRTSDIQLSAVKKYNSDYGIHLLNAKNINNYKTILHRLGIPIEAVFLDDIRVAEKMFFRVLKEFPIEVFHAIQTLSDDKVRLFFLSNHSRYTQEELVALVGAFDRPMDYKLSQEKLSILPRLLDIRTKLPVPSKINIKTRSYLETSL